MTVGNREIKEVLDRLYPSDENINGVIYSSHLITAHHLSDEAKYQQVKWVMHNTYLNLISLISTYGSDADIRGVELAFKATMESIVAPYHVSLDLKKPLDVIKDIKS